MILPKERIGIQRLNIITNIDKEIVEVLYQPIIGSTALALYLFFVQQTVVSNRISMQHIDIFHALNFGSVHFNEAKNKLEAIGLLKTYQTTKESLEKYIYEVRAPISIQQFFKDPIYSHLLLGMVGEKQYQNIKARYRIKKFDLTQYKEITKSFTAVYQKVSVYQDTDVSDIVNNDKGLINTEETLFDFEFFNQLIKGSYIFPQQLTPQVKQAIQNLHSLYGVTPLEMKNFILQVHDIETNEVNVDRLYRVVRNNYQNQVKVDTAKFNSESTKQTTSNTAVPKKDKLFNLFKNYASVDFIYMIKKSKSKQSITGLEYQVSDSELHIIEMLQSKYKFNVDVINVMIYYILVVSNNDSLHKRYVEKIANTWVKEELGTCDKAWEFLENPVLKRDEVNSVKTTKKIKKIKLTEEEKQALNETSTPAQEEWLAMLETRGK